jgi:hypothetical protein
MVAAALLLLLGLSPLLVPGTATAIHKILN